MLKKNIKKLNKERGSAIVETLPLLIIFMTILGNIWGFFMAVHSGILSSIGARTYAFETFRNRTDLTYFRDQQTSNGSPSPATINYYKTKVRVHAVTKASRASSGFKPMTIDYGRFSPTQSNNPDKITSHSIKNIFYEKERREGVKKIWLRSSYGICLNFKACKEAN